MITLTLLLCLADGCLPYEMADVRFQSVAECQQAGEILQAQHAEFLESLGVELPAKIECVVTPDDDAG